MILALPLIFLLLVIILIYEIQINNDKIEIPLLSLTSNRTYINKNTNNNVTNIKEISISSNVITNFSLKKEELIFDNISVSYNKAIPYIQKNIEGKLDSIYNNTNSEEIIPLVSAIIPVYNSKSIILRSIRSIQNQDMKNIEIILVNDCSSDNTLSYIENLQKEDSRIKIINNQKNMGILYSRSIGALSAKGKYIFPLDNGDMFLDYDVFSTIYNIANKDDFDIIEFRCVNVPGLYNLKGN